MGTFTTTNPQTGSVRPRIGRIALTAFAAIFSIATLLGTIYTVPEGHVGITTRFSKAIDQVGPGFHVKVPWIDGVREIEVRERKNVEDLASATNNQLPITATVSVNWSVDSTAALDLYKRYGGLDQFEERILDPKLRQAAKAALAQFNADKLIRNRNEAIAEIQKNMVELMAPYPVTVHSPQIENLSLPETYMTAVLDKERAREAAVREEYNLEKQRLEAAQTVQTADADRDATKARADGEAYKIRTEAEAEAAATKLAGEAEAFAIDKVNDSLAQNPLFVEYEQAKRWNGALPTTMIPGGSVPFIGVK